MSQIVEGQTIRQDSHRPRHFQQIAFWHALHDLRVALDSSLLVVESMSDGADLILDWTLPPSWRHAAHTKFRATDTTLLEQVKPSARPAAEAVLALCMTSNARLLSDGPQPLASGYRAPQALAWQRLSCASGIGLAFSIDGDIRPRLIHACGLPGTPERRFPDWTAKDDAWLEGNGDDILSYTSAHDRLAAQEVLGEATIGLLRPVPGTRLRRHQGHRITVGLLVKSDGEEIFLASIPR